MDQIILHDSHQPEQMKCDGGHVSNQRSLYWKTGLQGRRRISAAFLGEGGDEEWGRITSKERKIKEENKGEKNRG
jgi:hypothetical protein